jgi:hypothetical protein
MAGPAVAAIVSGVLASRQHRPAATGWLMTAVAAGALIGSLLWTWRPVQPARTPLTVMITLIGTGAPLAVAAITTSSLTLTRCCSASRGLPGPFTGAMFTTRKHYAPDEVQAEVFTISAGLRLTMAAAGAAIGGAIAGLPSPTQLLLVASAPLLCGGLGALTLGFTSARKRSA